VSTLQGVFRQIDEISFVGYLHGMEPSKYYRVAIAAELAGVKRTTLVSAIERGEVPAEILGCTLLVVKLTDVRKWAKQERKPGRKPNDA
jgi:excisionase family DNA binding protein